MIASMMGTFNSLSTFCSRRKPQHPSEPAKKPKLAVPRRFGPKHASRTLRDSDDIGNLSTDVGDCNTDFITTSGSETDVCKSVHRSPPGLALPPGLEAPPGLTAFSGHNAASRSTRLNSQAPVFVPQVAAVAEASAGQHNKQQLRQSIRQLKSTLEEFEDNVGTKYPDEPVASADDNTLIALQQALSKLTPQDTAKLRTFLATKEEAERTTKMTRTTKTTYGLQLDQLVPTRGHVNDFTSPPGLFIPAANNAPQTNAPATTHFARPVTPFGAQPASVSMGQQNRLPQTRPKMAPEAAVDGSVDTLRTNLKDLAALDSGLVLMVRKINRLGCDSAAAIESYFSKFGKIDRCMVTHSRSRPTPGGPARLRPATVGFLVMSDPEAVKAALSFNGGEHVVQGVAINVAPFKSHPIDAQD